MKKKNTIKKLMRVTQMQMPLTVENLSDVERNAFKLARELATSMLDTADKYRSFCIFARASLHPRQCYEILLLAGIRPDIAGTIKLVATVLPPAEYDQYITKQISFKVAIEKAREIGKTTGAVKSRKLKKSQVPKLLVLAEKVFSKSRICDEKDITVRVYRNKTLMILAPYVEQGTLRFEHNGVVYILTADKKKD